VQEAGHSQEIEKAEKKGEKLRVNLAKIAIFTQSSEKT
jgi:hypothetical protein